MSETPQERKTREDKRGKYYRKFDHSIEPVRKTHRRIRRHVRLLLQTRPEKVLEEQ